MPLNTNIALGVQTPQFESPMKMALVANQLRESQMKAQEYEAAMQERNALRQLNPADTDYANQLMRVSPTQGIAYRKSLEEAKSAEATRLKSQTEAFAAKRGIVSGMMRDLSARPDDENIKSHFRDVMESDLFTAQEKADLTARTERLLAIPFEERRPFLASQGASASELKPTMTPQNLGGTVQVLQTPAFGGKATVVPGSTGAVTQTPAQIEQAKRDEKRLGLEGQRVALEGQRVDLARKEAERKTQGLEALPPKEIQKREAAFPQATSVIKGFETKSDSFVKDLEKLRDHPGLSQITGLVAGRVPALTADGRAAQALYDKVVAKGGFQALQDLRDASKTGGALGNVSNQEGKQLTASFAAIDRRQDAADVKAAIEDAIGNVQGAKTRMREAYDSTYSYKSGTQAAPAADPLGIR
jgi:hypothetical protein